MVEKAISTPLRVKRGGRYLDTKRSAPRKKNTAGSAAAPFKGVRMRVWGKWVTEIRDPLTKTRIWLGSFATAEMAARAYDAAVVSLKGLSAPEVNFPESIPSFVIPQCNPSPKEIQAVALAAATASVPAAAPLAMVATLKLESRDAEVPEWCSSSVESWIDNELCAFEDKEAVVEPMRRQISDSVERAFLPWPVMADEFDGALNWFTNVPDMQLWSFS